MDTAIDLLSSWINDARSAVFFGGAGVSTASGIPDFRSAAGLYATQAGNGREPEYLLSHECLVTEPDEFFAFHRTNLVHPEAKPNRAHLALARLEHDGHLAAVVTQNIDGLHQAAGSMTVHELHGSVERNHCVRCGRTTGLADIPTDPLIPTCPECGGMVRPDVVLYGEGLDEQVIESSIRAIQQADVLIVGGTSLNVYPAAGLIRYYRGHRLVLINLTETPADKAADLVIHSPIDEVLDTVAQRISNTTPS